MFALLRWGGRMILGQQAAKRRWLRRIVFLISVLRWIDRRYYNLGTRIALKKGENLIVAVQKNGNSPQ